MDNKLQKASGKSLLGKVIEDREDAKSLAVALFKNILGQIPIVGAGTGTISDYYDAKVTKKRQQEVDSCIRGRSSD